MRLLALVLALALASCAHAPPPARLSLPDRQRERQELVAKLKRDLTKTDRSIAVTEHLVSQSRSAPYLPDLLFRLAELHVEKSRYRFHLEAEQRAESGVTGALVVPDVTLLKEKAISLYQRVLTEFPDFRENDKVRFYLAHEQRELGTYDKALKTYQELLEKHPKSPLATEALLILGDYHFDKSELDKAEGYYLKILERPASPAHDLARYKLGWVWINRGKHAEAVKFFEAAARSPLPDARADSAAAAKALSVKALAINDLVYSYTESRPPKGAVEYFLSLSDSNTTFETALEKLGNRYFIKDDFENATLAFRRLLTVSRDPEKDPDRAQRLYDAIKASKGKVTPRADDVRALVRVAARARLDLRMPEKEQRQLLSDFEVFARDLSTMLQVEAQRRDDKALSSDAADAYAAYLSLFRNPKVLGEMQKNRAEALFAAGRWAEAGRQFEEVARAASGDAQEAALYSAVVSFQSALGKDTGSYFDRVDSRSAVRQLGAFYVKSFPQNGHAPKVKFNVARAYYDDGDLKTATQLFVAFATEHPTDPDAVAAANLALDAAHAQKDYQALEDAGQRLLAAKDLPASLQQDVRAILASAKTEELSEAVLASDTGEGDVVRRLLTIADDPSRAGTDVAEKALVNAFSQAVSRRDFRAVDEVAGKILERFPKSPASANVTLTQARLATEVADYERAAQHFEAMSDRFPGDSKSVEALETAAGIRELLGDAKGALADVEKAAASGKKATTWVKLAELRHAAGDLAGAEQAAETALKLDGGAAKAAAVLGQALLDENNAALASQRLVAVGKVLQKAQVQEPDDLARVYFLWGESVFRQFSELGPEELEKKAQLLQTLQQAYTSAAQLGGDWAVAGMYRLAQSLTMLADTLLAVAEPANLSASQKKEFRAAVESQAKPLTAQAAEVYDACARRARELEVYTPFALGCATRSAIEERPAAAVGGGALGVAQAQPFREALAKNPADAAALEGLAQAFTQAGDLRRARLTWLRLLEVDEQRSSAHGGLGFVLASLGEPDLARMAYRRALELDAQNDKARANLAALKCRYGDKDGAAQELAKLAAVPSGPDVDGGFAACRR